MGCLSYLGKVAARNYHPLFNILFSGTRGWKRNSRGCCFVVPWFPQPSTVLPAGTADWAPNCWRQNRLLHCLGSHPPAAPTTLTPISAFVLARCKILFVQVALRHFIDPFFLAPFEAQPFCLSCFFASSADFSSVNFPMSVYIPSILWYLLNKHSVKCTYGNAARKTPIKAKQSPFEQVEEHVLTSIK